MEKTLHLFEGFGIELEYMIVNGQSLSVLPVADEVIKSVTGEFANDARLDDMEWSNELALHVIELKTPVPVASLDALPEVFHKNVLHINKILSASGGKLMPTAMHPWMDPLQEMRLWPHDNSPIYDAYNRIFDCRGHGWANLQSMHINLPFGDDDEFGRLHAAIRLILPLLPALAASSPIAEQKVMDWKDYRLEVYRHNQSRVPSIAGKIIPEAVFSKEDYESHIFMPLFSDIAPYDPEGVLQEEWLNSRGAIARWDRNAIEIRLLDIQECPKADIAIAAFVVEVLKNLISEKWISYEKQKEFNEDDMAYILMDCIRLAEDAEIRNPDYLHAMGLVKDKATAKELWQHLFEACSSTIPIVEPIITILEKGTLATRILNAIGSASPDSKTLANVYGRLCECLEKNEMFGII